MPALDNEFTIQRKPSEPWFVLTLLMIKKKTFFYQWVNAWLIEFLVIFLKFKVHIFCYKGLNRNSINTVSRLSKRKVLSVFSGGLTESFTASSTSASSRTKGEKNISWIQCFDIELCYIVKRYWAVLCLVQHARLIVCLLVQVSSLPSYKSVQYQIY